VHQEQPENKTTADLTSGGGYQFTVEIFCLSPHWPGITSSETFVSEMAP
jgi:hypothetical protein